MKCSTYMLYYHIMISSLPANSILVLIQNVIWWCIANFPLSDSTIFASFHHHLILDPVLSPPKGFAGFRVVIVFVTALHFVWSHASFFTWPFFFISFSMCFFHVCFDGRLRLQPRTSNSKSFTITFSSFLKTWSYTTAYYLLLPSFGLGNDK